MYFSSLDFFSNKFRSDFRNINEKWGGFCGVTAVADAGVCISAGCSAAFFELFFDGVKSETCRNFKRYGSDGVRNNRNLDFLSDVSMALSSRNKSFAFFLSSVCFSFSFFLSLSFTNGDEKSEWNGKEKIRKSFVNKEDEGLVKEMARRRIL
jgi:hypothetical protein